MPCRVSVRVPEARNLPVMDRQSESTDAFIEVRLGKDDEARKSEVCRHSLNPTWESADWFRFELDDDELQDEPLQVRVVDHDRISAHDVIGRVYVPLGPLMVGDTQTRPSAMDGWFPIYDTLRGARGEVRVIVKLEVLMDANRYRQSSAGVRFCALNSLPDNYRVARLHGFVEELVVNDDPEYQWIDNIRSKRKSNEERQSLVQKLSCELQRRVGVKVLEAGANAVLGYRQCIDLEGEKGIVLRCIGTMAQLEVLSLSTPPFDSSVAESRPTTLAYTPPSSDTLVGTSAGNGMNMSPVVETSSRFVPPPLNHTPSEPIIPIPLSAQVSSSFSEDDFVPFSGPTAIHEASAGARRTSTKPLWFRNQMMSTTAPDFPFLTVTCLPPGVLVHIGGLVACRSVEFLGLLDNADEPESRDAWWLKLRREVMSHAQTWGCNAVIGYEERVTMDEEVVVLSAFGTAAVIQFYNPPISPFVEAPPPSASGQGFGNTQTYFGSDEKPLLKLKRTSSVPNNLSSCSLLHVPERRQWSTLISHGDQSRCVNCNQAFVPSILLCSVEIPAELAVIGQGCVIQSRVCRPKKKASGEAHAVAISALLPFVESTLHQQLVSKLNKLKMNAVFGLQTQLSISESCVIAIATGTAVRLAALPLLGEASTPAPSSPVRRDSEDANTSVPEGLGNHRRRPSLASADGGRESTDLGRADRSTFLTEGRGSSFVELDDLTLEEDGSTIGVTMNVPNMWWSTLQSAPGCPNVSPTVHSQHLCVVQRVTVDAHRNLPAQLYRCLDNALQRLAYRASLKRPCCVCKVEFDIMQGDGGDDIQVVAKASVFALEGAETRSVAHLLRRDSLPTSSMLQALEATSGSTASPGIGRHHLHQSRLQRFQMKHTNTGSGSALSLPTSVLISSCDMVPGYHLIHHRAHICVFLIRESTSLREDHGSLGGFLHGFLVDAQALMRSHVSALGCNALLSFRLEVSELEESSNQCQCFMVLSGDAVLLSESPVETSRDTAV